MAQYFLHYGTHTFELADAKAAVELRSNLRFALGRKATGDVRAKTTSGLVFINVFPGVPVAISATDLDAATETELDDEGEGSEFH